MSQQVINLTPEAQEHVKTMLADKEGVLGIRIGVKDSGCSGLAYTIDFADSKLDNDIVVELADFNIYISEDSLKYVEGTELFLTEGINSILKFKNPNAVNECGCGESFQFKD